jgi:hypothetical protein
VKARLPLGSAPLPEVHTNPLIDDESKRMSVHHDLRRLLTSSIRIALLAIIPATAGLAAPVTAQEHTFDHRDIDLLDDYGEEVIVSLLPVSPGRTCGGCHDLDLLAGHAGHPLFRLDLRPGERRASLDLVAPPGEHCDQCHARPPISQDVHAGSGMECLDCHFRENNSDTNPVSDGLDSRPGRCEVCHDALASHEWLPYRKRHMNRVLCEVCHIPRSGAPARRVVDWTVLTPEGKPRVEYRGIRDVADNTAGGSPVGYRPLTLTRVGGESTPNALAPYNLITTWSWKHGEPSRPAPLDVLKTALISGGTYRENIASALDSNRDGAIGEEELALDTPAKLSAVRERLVALGLTDPHISGEIRPYGLHHGVVPAEEATRNCAHCHSESTDLAREFTLASAAPLEALPYPAGETGVRLGGAMSFAGRQLLYTPAASWDGFYILGYDRWGSVDTLGLAAVLAAVAAVGVHGGIRLVLWRSRRPRN